VPAGIVQLALSVAVTTFDARAIELIAQFVVPAIVIADPAGMFVMLPFVNTGVKLTGAFVELTAVPSVP
jgi:hypothetical protein